MRSAARALAPAPDANAQAIAATVLYAALFEYPLTLAQLRQSLIESAQTEAEVLATYRHSEWLRDRIDLEEGFFFPAGRRDLIGVRRRREQCSLRFLKQHRAVLTLICSLPFVRMVAISGSLAHLNLDARGDLDLFIVTRGRRVWSVTVAIVLLAKLLGCRRTVCANFVLADSRLAVDQPDLFTANQIIHLKTVAGIDVFREFVSANPFVTAYYPNYAAPDAVSRPFGVAQRARRLKRAAEWVLAGPSLLVEPVCRWSYRGYLRGRARLWRSPQQVVLDPDCLKLHTQSHREPVLARFDAAVIETLGCDFTHTP